MGSHDDEASRLGTGDSFHSLTNPVDEPVPGLSAGGEGVAGIGVEVAGFELLDVLLPEQPIGDSWVQLAQIAVDDHFRGITTQGRSQDRRRLLGSSKS